MNMLNPLGFSTASKVTRPPKSFNVLLLGETCEDQYIYGKIERLNPESSAPVLRYVRREVRQGMSANVAENLDSFGVNVTHITHTEKIVKTRYVDDRYNQHLLRMDIEDKVTPFLNVLPPQTFDAIVISDYDKGFLTFDKILQIAETYTCPIFIDSKKRVLPDREECFVKINLREYQRLQVKIDNLIVTLGEQGAIYKGDRYPTDKVSVSDLVGAGDTFLAALTYDYLYTRDISHAIMFANKAAAIAVQHPGTYVLQQEDVDYLNNLTLEVQ